MPLLLQLDVQNGVIRVQAPDLTKSSCLIQLDEQMTAGDIVDKFRRDHGTAHMGGHRYTLHFLLVRYFGSVLFVSFHSGFFFFDSY